MDSTNPFSQSPSNFMALLSSQQEHVELFSSPMRNESVEVPLYSTQSAAPSLPEEAPEERRGRRKWTPIEDVVLISSWLNTSKDAVVGNEQKAEAFWKRIAEYFAHSPKHAGVERREPNHCKQRWQKINDLVCKFVGAYEAAKSQKTSGCNENDVLKLAHQIFYNDHKQKFTLEHAWMELRNDQKWCASAEGNSKRRKVNDGSAQSSTGNSNGEEHTMVRPQGVKAAKGKGKRSVSSTTSLENTTCSLIKFQSMWEIKEKDLAMQEKLKKMGLLDSLLAKNETLTEIEITLKDKLITEMLNKSQIDEKKGSSDSAKQMGKAQARAAESEKQNLEAEKQVRFFQGSVAAAFSERENRAYPVFFSK